jgi:hypothetical protein
MGRFSFLVALCLFAFTNSSYSQTTLVAGDIAFTGYNLLDNTVNGSPANDDICFILLKNITAGTIINFTDFGWRSDANAFHAANPCGASTGSLSDGIIRWTASTNMTYGTQVRIRCKTNLSATAGSVMGIQSTANAATEYLSLSTAGDHIFAYQGTHGSPTLIAGISMSGAWDMTLTQCELSSTKSTLPPALSTNNYAFFISPELDNGRVKTSILITQNAATDRAAFHNTNNWDLDNLNSFLLPPVLTFLPVKFSYVRIGALTRQIEWGVAEEHNVRAYYIEQSLNGVSFSEIGNIPASGLNDYKGSGITLTNGYYRIKALDSDNKLTYSPIVRYTTNEANEELKVRVQDQSLFLQFSSLQLGRYTCNVFSAEGKLKVSKTIDHNGTSGSYVLGLDQKLSSGIYLVSLSKGTSLVTCKVWID